MFLGGPVDGYVKIGDEIRIYEFFGVLSTRMQMWKGEENFRKKFEKRGMAAEIK